MSQSSACPLAKPAQMKPIQQKRRMRIFNLVPATDAEISCTQLLKNQRKSSLRRYGLTFAFSFRHKGRQEIGGITGAQRSPLKVPGELSLWEASELSYLRRAPRRSHA